MKQLAFTCLVTTLFVGSASMRLEAAQQLPLRLDFDDPAAPMPFAQTRQVTTQIKDGLLRVEVTDGDPQLRLPVPARGPIILKTRMRSGEGAYDRLEIFWRHESEERFSPTRVAMFPIEHDMQWREYEFPLPVVDGPIVLRLDTGWKPGIFEFDWIVIEDKPLASDITARIAAMPDQVSITDGTLEVTANLRDNHILVTDTRTGRDWRMETSGQQWLIIDAAKADEQTIALTLFDPAMEIEYQSSLELQSDGVLTIDLDSEDQDAQFWALRNWPPAITSDLQDGRIVFADRSSGTLIDQRDRYYGGRDLMIYGNTQCADMPFVGLFDWNDKDGVIVLAETPYDGEFVLERDDDGVIWPRLRWLPSMDTFRYARRMSYRFSPADGHVGLARLYADHADTVGLRKTLAEKAAERPEVDNFMGGAIIWGSVDAKQFVQEARPYGLLRAGLGNASHGLRRAESIRELNEMGYITFDYDSFSDIMDGPTGLQSDDVDETAYHSRPGLGPKGGWINPDGTRYSDRSSAFALRAVKSYVPELLEKFGFNGRFIDVSMAITLQEDWHPEHTFDRRQDMAYKRDAFEWYMDQGLVMGTEHGNDWGIDLVDFSEGAVGSPLHWKRQGTWYSGGFAQPTSEDDYSEEWLKYGAGYDTSIPLWQLVYHDAVVSSWYWGDNPGIHYNAAPWIADRKDLMTLLYGGMNLMWRDHIGYDWNKNRERFVRSYHDTAHFQRAVAYTPMTNHEFLSEDMALQRTTFADGTTVAVNFGTTPRRYDTSDNGEVTLAPLGYWARGPAILQTRTVEDGQIIKRIEAEGFRQYEAERRTTIGPVNFEGLFTAFRMPDESWQFWLEPDRLCEIDVAELTGWDGPAPDSIYELDDIGRPRTAIKVEEGDRGIILRTGANGRFFSLHNEAPSMAPLIYPPSGEIVAGTPIQASMAYAGHVIRMTTDGSEPTSQSPRFPSDGLTITDSTTVKTRAFAGDRAVGETAVAEYIVIRRIHESDIMRSGEDACFVNVSVRGGSRLRLRVDHGGDYPWADFVDLGYPTLVRADGSEVKLTDLDYTINYVLDEEPTIDIRDDDGPLIVGGRHFTTGLGLRSETELVFEIGDEFDRLTTWVGINDRAANNPSLIQGTATLTLELLP